MRIFIFSYLFSIIPLSIVFYPTFQVAPFEAIMRIGFYLGFPLAIVISLAVIVLKELMGFSNYSADAESAIHKAADGSVARELKVS